MCVLRQTEMHFLGYLVIAVFLIHSSVVSGQSNTTLMSVVKASTITSTPVGTTGSISPTKSMPSPSSSSTVPTQATLTTSVAAKTSKPATKESSRKFDGASFVGGIILGAFLTVIFILVYKWWQGRSKSYHSLWVKLRGYWELWWCWKWIIRFYNWFMSFCIFWGNFIEEEMMECILWPANGRSEL